MTLPETVQPRVHDDRACELGEGALWHPGRQALFWFDILANRLLCRDADGPGAWQFDRHVSAAGWIDHDSLLIASETDLFRLDLQSGRQTRLVALEPDNPATRSNDGRADPQGGFWIGTMGKGGETGAGALYRWYRGELRCLQQGLTVPNAICFAPAGDLAYYADTRQRRIWRQPLDRAGWPLGEAAVFLDFGPEGPKPDGAVTDAEGCLWNAQWGSGRVARYSPEGVFLGALALPASHVSCPAFGGPGLDRLFVTTARQKLSAAQLATEPAAGCTFMLEGVGPGRAEPAVQL